MSKVLNQVCFCGSNKKFKKCCKAKILKLNQDLVLNWAEDLNKEKDNKDKFQYYYEKFIKSFYSELFLCQGNNFSEKFEFYEKFWQFYCQNLKEKRTGQEYYFSNNVKNYIGEI